MPVIREIFNHLHALQYIEEAHYLLEAFADAMLCPLRDKLKDRTVRDVVTSCRLVCRRWNSDLKFAIGRQIKDIYVPSNTIPYFDLHARFLKIEAHGLSVLNLTVEALFPAIQEDIISFLPLCVNVHTFSFIGITPGTSRNRRNALRLTSPLLQGLPNALRQMTRVIVLFVAMHIHPAARERLMTAIASMPTLRVLGLKFELYFAHSREDGDHRHVDLPNIHTLLVDTRADGATLPASNAIPESNLVHANLRTIAVAFDLDLTLKDQRDLASIREILLRNPGVSRFVASHEEPFPPTELMRLSFHIPQTVTEISVPSFIPLIDEEGSDTLPNLFHITLQTDLLRRISFEEKDVAICQLEQRIKNMNRDRFQSLSTVHLRGIRMIRTFRSEELRFDSCLRALLLSSRLSLMNVSVTDEFHSPFPKRVRFTIGSCP